MAAALVSSAKVPQVSRPLPISSHSRRPNPPPEASSSRYPQQAPAPDVFTSTSSTSETASRSFQRFFENSFRTATRSKKVPTPPVDEFATITAKAKKGKEKEREIHKSDEAPSHKLNVFRKVTFRGKSGQEPPATSNDGSQRPKERVAGKTSFITPSMRQASMSSPALHLSSQALPSPKSQSAVPASSSSNADVLVSPTRPRTRRVSMQPAPPKEISAPSLPSPRTTAQGPTRHRSSKSVPVAIPPSPSSPSLPSTSSESPVPTRVRHVPASPSHSPTPYSTSRVTPIRSPSKTSGSATPRASSPACACSPSNRIRVATPSRGGASASTSHLPLSSSPSPTPRRPSVDSPRRQPIESPRRTSADYARRPSLDVTSRQSPSPFHGEPPSPIRPRSRTPSQRAYSQNRHFNISAGSLLLPSNPEHRDLIRTATSMLCKEILKPPPHMAKTDAGVRDWKEVEARTAALVRLERIWSRPFSPTTSQSSPTTGAGEERERKLFCDALRDGFVLCQLLNKLRSSSVVRPDPREDGVTKSSNVTKFLAGCASYGLSGEDLFQQDDLIDGSSESLARVAQTIIALIKFVESPVPSRSKYMSGQGKSKPLPPSPYGTLSKSSNSTPNLLSTNPQSPASPTRKRWSPPSDLPPLRSYSPGEKSVESVQTIRGVEDEDSMDEDGEEIEVKQMAVPIIKRPPPPPKSPLRKQASKSNDVGGLSAWSRATASPTRVSIASSTQATIGDISVRDSIPNIRQSRQSMASSVLSSTTLSTAPSSLLDNGQGNLGNSSISETFARSSSIDIPKHRDRRSGEVQMTRVAEETDESISRVATRVGGETKERGNASHDQRNERPAVHLRKGKWPDDFFDAFQMPNPARSSILDPDESLSRASPVSISKSSPRKIAIVGANRLHDDGSQPLPRRPTHRPRHSIDTPGLLPKEVALRRDASPDSSTSRSPSGRVLLRRHSTKPATPTRTSLAPRSDDAPGSRGSDDSLVPFPRDRSTGVSTPTSPGGDNILLERPRLRGRFQSEIEGASGRRGRPNSYDDVAARPARGRIESMVNLGVTSAATSASDLLARNSLDGSTGRALIVKEAGKPPTHFQLGNCIGRGQFGSVYRALNLNTGQMVAVKRIRLEGLKEEEVTQLMREVDLVKSLSHPSIVKYEGMARDEDTLSIVLEYAENGSLGQTLKAFGKLNERLVASYVVKILEGLHYLHTSDVVHCDLKAANILTTKNGNVKLSDFGVSLNLRAMEREIKDVAGTPNWMAPEVIELKGASIKSDIWSLGCTVIELLTGRPPYADITNSMSVMFRIVEDDMPPLPEGCSELLEDFLKQCLQKDPNNRPTAELLCEHEWLKANWMELKDLRPQDSIPFLRRVSTDMQKSDVSRYFNQFETPDSPVSEGFVRGDAGRVAPISRRTSNLSVRPPPENDISPREHTFVKTTFSKPMMCRVCLLNVKKSAVLCAQCSLISHAKCAASAPPTCDLRAQLLLYAQYAEKGNPSSAYSNPKDLLGDTRFPVAMSDVPFVSSPSSARTETPPPSSPIGVVGAHSESPPTAFKFKAAFKRSRSNLTPEPAKSPSSTPAPQEPGPEEPRRRRPTLLSKRPERPLSVTSDSTNMSSLRSAATAAESLNSGSGSRNRSASSSGGRAQKGSRYTGGLASTAESEHNRSSTQLISELSTSSAGVAMSYPGPITHPTTRTLGSLSPDPRRHKRNAKSAGNCVIQ
ncbi:STE/STE11 protein kinase [Coprinopsis cinerea AmutBmut pab1-1]|nr:STE/STE11 protein kinase [Coprinopsis cinerea AmutBmut pab1-1]